MKRRVLYVAHGHPAFSTGGGELAAAHLYQAMKAAGGYEPHLLARIADAEGRVRGPDAPLIRWQPDDSTHLIVSDSCHYDYFCHSRIASGAVEADLFEPFRELLLGLKPDVVHFQHFIHLGVDLISYVRSLLPGAKIVLTLHEYEAICANQGLMLEERHLPSLSPRVAARVLPLFPAAQAARLLPARAPDQIKLLSSRQIHRPEPVPEGPVRGVGHRSRAHPGDGQRSSGLGAAAAPAEAVRAAVSRRLLRASRRPQGVRRLPPGRRGVPAGASRP